VPGSPKHSGSVGLHPRSAEPPAQKWPQTQTEALGGWQEGNYRRYEETVLGWALKRAEAAKTQSRVAKSQHLRKSRCQKGGGEEDGFEEDGPGCCTERSGNCRSVGVVLAAGHR